MDRMTSWFNLAVMKSLWILGANFKFKGFKKLPKDRPIVFLSNHQSMWDIPPLMWKFRRHHPKFIAKKELTKFIPSVSFNINFGGSVAIDRSKPKESIKRITAFAKKINAKKFAVCIFPEGTRTMNGPMKPFKKSGIETLLKEMPNALFVPIAIKNTGKIDYKGKFLKRLGVRVTYSFLKPRNLTLENAEAELAIMRAEMITAIA
jgi:1-acyl-sn-glycerol-3-phosphate acyltransferase